MFSMRLADLAKQLDAELYGNGDVIITAIASITSAKAGTITFLVNPKYRKHLINCQASAIVLTRKNLPFVTGNALIVPNPYLAYAHMAKIFNSTPQSVPSIAVSAIIDSSAQLGNNISIGHNTTIESDVIIGNNVIIGASCFIGRRTKIGDNSYLSANVTIYHEIEIGKRCFIQSGSVIGVDGFGYANDEGDWVKIPQLGRVIIGDRVEIGSCTTIARGTLDDTVIGNGVIIDNQCQIAHNVVIGDNTAVAGGVIMAGSLKVGKYCMIGGASVINGHIEICDKVIITGMGMVMKSITKPGIYSSGIPLQPNKKWRKTAVLVMNIDDMNKRLRVLEGKINQQD